MNKLSPCWVCGELIDPAAWCPSCVDSGRADYAIIHSAVFEAWQRDEDLPGIAERVYQKLVSFGRIEDLRPIDRDATDDEFRSAYAQEKPRWSELTDRLS